MPAIPSSTLPVGLGIMNFTSMPTRKFTPAEFNSTFKQIVDNAGASVDTPLFVNGGEFYGIPDRHENIKLLGGFFETYPEYADRIYLSIKAGVNSHWAPDNAPASLKSAIDAISLYLKPLYAARKHLPKSLDMFTLARIAEEPIEDTMHILQSYLKEGLISSICLSEIAAPTLARALTVAPVAAIEIEFSLFHHDAADNGLFKLCSEHDIAVVCYSPLSKGVLTGMTASDLKEGDFRLNFDKFSKPDVIAHNKYLVDNVKRIGAQLDITPAQVALSWITSISGTQHNDYKIPLLIPIPGSTNVKRASENLSVKHLGPEPLGEIDTILKDFQTAGYRYNAAMEKTISR